MEANAMITDVERLAASFRDPAGFVFRRGGELFRSITPVGMVDFSHFISSGLAETLLEREKLVVFFIAKRTADSATLRLEELPFISWPFEWSFSQLRDAAALTLELMRTALQYGMILKDASAFNIAFHAGHPVFIDHTSFTLYREGEPWCAYRQFVRHFLAPLLLMRHVDLRILELLRSNLDGIPLDLAARLLPWYTKLIPGTLIHVHRHALMDERYSSSTDIRPGVVLPRRRLEALLTGLSEYVDSLRPPPQNTPWKHYYAKTNYTEAGFEAKKRAVEEFCRRTRPRRLVDLGANTGEFSVVAADHCGIVIAVDRDAQTVEQLYDLSRKCFPNLMPVLLDLNDPTPATGVFNRERESFFDRLHSDAALGLALIHHLRVDGNWTLRQIVELFERTSTRALVEFVPAEDSQFQRLIRGRDAALYADWTMDALLAEFRKKFSVVRVEPLPGSKRSLIEISMEDKQNV